MFVRRIAVVVTLLLLGCARSSARDSARSTDTQALPALPADVVVIGNAIGAPAGCSGTDIARRVVAMFDAINRADSRVVEEHFGRERNARFYFLTLQEHGPSPRKRIHRADDWSELDGLWQERFRQHERLRLRRIQVNRWNDSLDAVNLGPIEVTRTADDLMPGMGGPGYVAIGQGLFHCGTQAVVKLGLAMHYQAP